MPRKLVLALLTSAERRLLFDPVRQLHYTFPRSCSTCLARLGCCNSESFCLLIIYSCFLTIRLLRELYVSGYCDPLARMRSQGRPRAGRCFCRGLCTNVGKVPIRGKLCALAPAPVHPRPHSAAAGNLRNASSAAASCANCLNRLLVLQMVMKELADFQREVQEAAAAQKLQHAWHAYQARKAHGKFRANLAAQAVVQQGIRSMEQVLNACVCTIKASTQTHRDAARQRMLSVTLGM